MTFGNAKKLLVLACCIVVGACGDGSGGNAADVVGGDTPVGELCTAGTPQTCTTSCGQSGLKVCATNGTWGSCIGPDEECNGLDDDCDGTTDQRADGTPLVTPCYCGQDMGVETCVLGVWGPCSAGNAASAEKCNNVDDDCDNLVDEECDKDFDDYCDGTKETVGTPDVCPGGGGDCTDDNATVHPNADELCNGVDDDCNGKTDEDMGITNCGQGECVHDEPACIDGAPNQCDPLQGAQPEADFGCDQKDNDCDGTADEGVEGCCVIGEMEECSLNTGECEKGTWTCQSDGTFGPCSGVLPADELCDGKDNDCDGDIDNGNPGGGEPCGTDQGECSSGVYKCMGGDLKCSNQVSPVNESCDGKDNDCDGVTDEGMDSDKYEDNQVCTMTWDLGDIKENAAQPLVVTATLYKDGAEDVDFFKIVTNESSNFWPCALPTTDDCYGLLMFLDVPDGYNFDLCAYAQDCNGTEFKGCSASGGKGVGETLELVWPGVWGGNDNKIFFVEVKGSNALENSCVPYTLSFQFVGECPVDGKCWWQ